jgi:hypothetical protein
LFFYNMTIEEFISEFARVAPLYKWGRSQRVLLGTRPGTDGRVNKYYIPVEVVARDRGFTEEDALVSGCIYNWAKLLELSNEDASKIGKASMEPVDKCSPMLKSHLFRAAGLL